MSFTINEASISAKVTAFGKSPAGKALTEKIISTKIESGIELCKITGNVLTKAEMLEAAHIMRDLLSQHAMGLPASVQGLVSGIGIGSIEQVGEGKYTVALSFQGDLSRPSLVPSKYGGVSNIIALFNNGYYAKSRVYGEWPGHGKTLSRQERSGLHFVNQAVAAFNGMCGAKYHATAEAGAEYR